MIYEHDNENAAKYWISCYVVIRVYSSSYYPRPPFRNPLQVFIKFTECEGHMAKAKVSASTKFKRYFGREALNSISRLGLDDDP